MPGWGWVVVAVLAGIGVGILISMYVVGYFVDQVIRRANR